MICLLEENCVCLHHQIIDCLKNGQNETAKKILKEAKNSSEWTDISGSSLLHYSAKYYDNIEMTEHLIMDVGCKVNAQNKSGLSPLMLAIVAKNSKTVEILLNNKANIYLSDCEGKNSLEKALKTRLFSPRLAPLQQPSHSILEMLFDRFNHDFANSSFPTKLLSSNANGNNNSLKLAIVAFARPKIARHILKNYDYPVDFQDTCLIRRTALHCAVLLAKCKNALILMKHGANVDVQDNHGYSPFYFGYTIFCEDADEESKVLTSFLRYSKKLSIPNSSGYTDVEQLLIYGKEKTVKTTLQNSNVNIDKCISQDRFLLYMLTVNKKLNSLDLLDELDIKFDLNRRYGDGRTTLMGAAFYGYLKKVEFLLRHGIDVNATSFTEHSALTSAIIGCTDSSSIDIENNYVQVIDLLLQYGVDVLHCLNNAGDVVVTDFANKFSPSTKIILAHLAMLLGNKIGDQPFVHNLLDHRITKSQLDKVKIYFDECVQQLTEMKDFKVHDTTVSLFDLLTKPEKTISAFARNPEFIGAFTRTMENFTHLNTYYLNTLQRRVSRALSQAKLAEKVALVIEALTGLCCDVYYAIVCQIISYLDQQDLHNLCQINNTL